MYVPEQNGEGISLGWVTLHNPDKPREPCPRPTGSMLLGWQSGKSNIGISLPHIESFQILLFTNKNYCIQIRAIV